MWKYVIAWFPMVILAIANGLVREAWYGDILDERTAHQVSTLAALILFGVYIRFVVRRWPPASPARAVAIGLLWLALTVAFEFLFGHYVAGHPWGRLLRDYDLSAGRLWVLILAMVTAAPYVFWRLHTRRRD